MATTKVRGELVDLNESTSESGLKIPSGTEVNRPTAVAGQIRNNTNEASEGSASCEEYYNGTEWKKINNTALPPPLAFKALLYTGNSSTQSITGVGFQPDLVWIQERTNTEFHRRFDSTRGATKYLGSDNQNAEGTGDVTLTSFDSDGFTLGLDNEVNNSGDNYVAWCFKANGGTTSSNGDGSITSTVQANTKAGFSIVKYTGTFASATVGHGLSSAPEMVIVKNLDISSNWWTWTKDLGGGDKYLALNLSSGVQTATSIWDGTIPTSTVFSVANDSGSNGSGNEIIAYCFHSVAGYSSIGTYTGNGSSSGPTVTTGFQPDFVMTKKASGTANWWIVDSSRSTSNPRNARLLANTTDAEVVFTPGNINFNSTGFELAGTSGEINGSGETYIYMALKTN